jgi:methyl-galactoside transport system ATP-binding protein
MAQDNFVLEMKGISKTFPGVKALDDVTLQVGPGTVHALMGENGAGKSTLMKCLFGIYAEDEGEILLEGTKVRISEPKKALSLGISMIHQELHPIHHRSVMENIWLGRFPMKRVGPLRFIDHAKMRQMTRDLFAQLDLKIDPDTIIGTLSVSTIQYIEIAKAISYNAKVIVMDEPTSSLTSSEVEHLFRLIADLKKRGVAIIYISHKMEEILKISDDVTIMRDGRKIGTWPAHELTIDTIISRMVGRDLTHRFPERSNKPNGVILKVDDLSSPFPRCFKNISFELKKGEILGIGGLVGAQRTELIEALFGLRSIESGRIFIHNQAVKIRSPQDAISKKVALLTEDRRATGIFSILSILENTVIANQRSYVNRLFLLNDKKRLKDTLDSIQKLKVKTPSHTTHIKNLSGGNQQKVLLARWLLTDPDILLLDEPTRGIDVGAKFEIYSIMTKLAEEGKSIIFISSELPELIGMSDRIMVMCEGRLSGIVSGEEANEEEIMRLATRFASPESP